MLIALIPSFRMFRNSDRFVRFTTPLCVANTTNFNGSHVESLSPSPTAGIRSTLATFSSGFRFSRFLMLRPFDVRDPSGIRYTRSAYTRPVFVKNISQSCELAVNKCSTKSCSSSPSSVIRLPVSIPFNPFPPRR